MRPWPEHNRRSKGSRPAVQTGTVSGSGTVVLKRKPDLLRMKVELIAQGKTMKEALANLKDRRDAAQAQLATLGAIKSRSFSTIPRSMQPCWPPGSRWR